MSRWYKDGNVKASEEDEHVEEASLASLGVSYKRQHFAARLRKFPGTVQVCDEIMQRVMHESK